MTPLEAARQLVENPPEAEAARYGECWYCQTAPHAPDCPWLAFPKIVAALEAANEVAEVSRDSLDGTMPWHLMAKLRRALLEEGKVSA